MIAHLGRRALEVTDPVALMNEAVHAVRDVLEAVGCAVTQRMANGEVARAHPRVGQPLRPSDRSRARRGGR
jgi:hypothetical protein